MKPTKKSKGEEGPARATSLLEERRRSQRVMLRMPVVLHVTGRPQPVRAVTVAVSEVGAMVLVADPLPVSAKLTVENPSTSKRVGARVSRAATLSAEGALIPIEFDEPAASFWNISFPPPSN